jgi:hypothetical protein
MLTSKKTWTISNDKGEKNDLYQSEISDRSTWKVLLTIENNFEERANTTPKKLWTLAKILQHTKLSPLSLSLLSLSLISLFLSLSHLSLSLSLSSLSFSLSPTHVPTYVSDFLPPTCLRTSSGGDTPTKLLRCRIFRCRIFRCRILRYRNFRCDWVNVCRY